MRIQLNIVEYHCEIEERGMEFTDTIALKLNGLFFEVPYIPQKGWKINIRPWLENEDCFTEQEKEIILDDPYFRVYDIYMHPDFLEIEIIYDGIPE